MIETIYMNFKERTIQSVWKVLEEKDMKKEFSLEIVRVPIGSYVVIKQFSLKIQCAFKWIIKIVLCAFKRLFAETAKLSII